MRHRGQQSPYDLQRKIRTPEHVAADLSYNFLERKVLQRGHWLDAPRNDYGIDATMFHHSRRGEVENGEVRFQLKAKNKLATSRDGTWVSQRVEMRDLRYWFFEPYPVIVVAYDVQRNRAFWLHIQQYIAQTPRLMDSDKNTITLRIPTRCKLNLHAIDRFQTLSLTTVASFREQHGGL
ncbi:MAG: DUF4365 domain-containing protein [Pirellulales bacterium]|nr:DUF4365 domain-containing protein [Pirellulales bacterium]